jgi:hypothetical protein
MWFKMFNPTIQQCLLVDVAIIALDDIGATVEVTRYCVAYLELQEAKWNQQRAMATV